MSFHDLTHIAFMGRPEIMNHREPLEMNKPWNLPKDDIDDLISGYQKAPVKQKYWQRLADHYGKHPFTVSSKVFIEMDKRGIKR